MEPGLAGKSVPTTLFFHDFLRRFAPDYLERFGAAMPQRQAEVLETILACRTAALGGQLYGCPDCEKYRYLYHSCNDRHCPLCGTTDADQWLACQQARLLLPVPYFLVTFTLPDWLRTWVRSHPKLGYDLLFAASSQALQDLARDPKRLGAQLAMLGVLHTWSRTLVFHPHIHYLIPGGGLSLDDRAWIASGPKFFLPYRPLANRFRTLFCEKLKQQAPELHAQIPEKIWTQRWNLNMEAAVSAGSTRRPKFAPTASALCSAWRRCFPSPKSTPGKSWRASCPWLPNRCPNGRRFRLRSALVVRNR